MGRDGKAAGASVRDRTPWCWRQHRWAHTRGRRRLGAALWEWVRPCCYHGCVGAPACQRTLCEGQEQHQVEHRLAEERRRAGDSLSAPSLEEARVAEYASVAGPRWSGWGAHGGMGRRGGAGARRTQRAGQGGALSRTREWSRGTGPAWCARPAAPPPAAKPRRPARTRRARRSRSLPPHESFANVATSTAPRARGSSATQH